MHGLFRLLNFFYFGRYELRRRRRFPPLVSRDEVGISQKTAIIRR